MDQPHRAQAREMPTQRTESFSDGVFAVAATLLVLNLAVHNVPPGGLASALGREWPHYATFVVSFLTIGIVWTNHHEMFERITRVDRPLVLLNLVLLLNVTVMPFTTGLLAGYLRGADEHVAAAVYAGSFLLLSVTFIATNTWSAWRGLWRAGISRDEMSQQLGRSSIGLILYTAAVGLAFVNAIVSLALCALAAAYYALPSRV
jgi:uncharacterized membrane protein